MLKSCKGSFNLVYFDMCMVNITRKIITHQLWESGHPPTSWTSHLHSSPLWSHRHHSDLSLTSQFNPFQILSVNSNISALVYIKSNLVICLVSFVWISAADLLLCWSQSRSVGMVSNSDASRPDLFHGHLLYEFSHKWKMKWNMKWNETKWN